MRNFADTNPQQPLVKHRRILSKHRTLNNCSDEEGKINWKNRLFGATGFEDFGRKSCRYFFLPYIQTVCFFDLKILVLFLFL